MALEPYLPADKINLSFAEGMLFRRMELLIDREVPAAALFSGPYYFAEQLGYGPRTQHKGSPRPGFRRDRPPRHLCRHRHGSRSLRRFGAFTPNSGVRVRPPLEGIVDAAWALLLAPDEARLRP